MKKSESVLIQMEEHVLFICQGNIDVDKCYPSSCYKKKVIVPNVIHLNGHTKRIIISVKRG